MHQYKQYIVLIVSLLFSLVFGVIATYTNYFPSSFFFVYLFAAIATVLLSLYIRIPLTTFSIKQGTFIGVVLIMFFGGWYLVKQDWRFGFFLYAAICFLVSGLILIRSGSIIGRVLFITAFIISVINVTPILFYISEKTLITQELISTVFISNKSEVSEYVFFKLNYQHILLILIFILASVLIFLFNKRNSPLKVPVTLWFLFFVSFFTVTISGPAGAVVTDYLSYLDKTKELTRLVEERSKRLQEYKITIWPDSNAAHKVVVIIGESLNRNYMGVYGYEKASTPNLSALLQDSSSQYRLFTFNNVISPEVTTVPSLEKVLTNISYRNPIPFEQSLSIVDYFNKAGYMTYWVSNQNQAQFGKFSTPVFAVAASAKHIYFTGNNDSTENGRRVSGMQYDETLFIPFEKFISADSTGKEVYFVHLLGSHWNYDDRYPEKFRIYKKNESGNLDSYLNSVLYNDWVVSRIMGIAKKYGADAVIYFSDHGEDLAIGHNPENFKPWMVEIPFIVYASEKYLNKNMSINNELRSNKNTPAMNDNFFHFIQDLTGVKSSLYDSTASFISPYYINKKRIVNNNSNQYDK